MRGTGGNRVKREIVRTLTDNFEAHAQQTEGGVEYWLARDLQHLLGYTEWRNFSSTVISKAKTACEVSGHLVSDHFVDVNKMVDLGSGSQREHITNNQVVRKTLLERGIRPESLPPAEDVKKVERRLASEEKKTLKKPDALDS
jgi:hypothetical protein